MNRTEALRALAKVAAQIRSEHPEVASVRLFGSLAKGDHVGTSDADVLIILRGDRPGHPLEWIRSFYGYFRLPIPVDLLVCNEVQLPDFEYLLNHCLEL